MDKSISRTSFVAGTVLWSTEVSAHGGEGLLLILFAAFLAPAILVLIPPVAILFSKSLSPRKKAIGFSGVLGVSVAIYILIMWITATFLPEGWSLDSLVVMLCIATFPSYIFWFWFDPRFGVGPNQLETPEEKAKRLANAYLRNPISINDYCKAKSVSRNKVLAQIENGTLRGYEYLGRIFVETTK